MNLNLPIRHLATASLVFLPSCLSSLQHGNNWDRYGETKSTSELNPPKNEMRHLQLASDSAEPWMQLGGDIDGEFQTDYFGKGVDISGDGKRLVSGGPLHNDGDYYSYHTPGHARIFQYELKQNAWIQIGEISGSNYYHEIGRGISMSHNGTRVALVGWNGDIEVYDDDGGVWIQVGSTIGGKMNGKISMSGDGMRLAGLNPNGSVRVLGEENGEWVQVGLDIDTGTLCYLSRNGKRLISGGLLSARVYEEDEGSWSQVGNDIAGYNYVTEYNNLAITEDGKRVAVSNADRDIVGNARIYDDVNGEWLLVFEVDGVAPGDRFGSNLALSGDGKRFAVSAPLNDDKGKNVGQVRLYEDVDGTWSLTAKMDGEGHADRSGESISFTGHGFRLAIGAPMNNRNKGHVRVFASPTCKDSPLFFAYKERRNSKCAWVAENPTKRCNWKAATHCPSACKRCEKLACMDSKATFILAENKQRTCEWLKNLDQHSIQRMCRRQKKIMKICRATCGYC